MRELGRKCITTGDYVTPDEIEWALNSPKVVTASVEWKPRPGGRLGSEATFSVLVPVKDDPDEYVLGKVEATHGTYKAKVAFLLGGVCIARWESGGRHLNPNGELIIGQHKHRWDPIVEDRFAYTPDDIEMTNRDTILMTFLLECGIEFQGTYRPQLPES